MYYFFRNDVINTWFLHSERSEQGRGYGCVWSRWRYKLTDGDKKIHEQQGGTGDGGRPVNWRSRLVRNLKYPDFKLKRKVNVLHVRNMDEGQTLHWLLCWHRLNAPPPAAAWQLLVSLLAWVSAECDVKTLEWFQGMSIIVSTEQD